MSQLVQERWHRKLENWALWIIGESPKIRQPAEDEWKCPPRPPQPLVGEALDVDALLVKMQSEGEDGDNRYRAVLAWYTWAGTVRDWAITLDCHPDTLNDRVKAARYRLEDLWQARHVAASTRRSNLLALAA